MKSIPFYLVTGFLGSGKTTLLKRFLDRYADRKRIAIIQNEFADGNIDGKELMQTGKSFEILEINQGSVFCVCLLSDFKSSLTELMDACQPDLIILEATGLADPIAIGQLLQAKELRDRLYLAHVWCIADTTSFLQMEANVTRIAHQIRVADTVILNKCDLVESETIETVAKRISVLNPHGKIEVASYCNLPSGTSLEETGQQTVAEENLVELLELCAEGRPDISSAIIRTTANICMTNLKQFIMEFEGKTYRMKGFVKLSDNRSVSIQSCFGSTSIKPVPSFSGPTELIAMGPGIDAVNFKQRYDHLLDQVQASCYNN
ncbi:MAG: GTP-binding protein [Deltaproteobacteria bacterium]|nr:GTP-binding protein [Deltaproteobacteria bacterium]MBT6504561.1 GTP-binding protein [Deltaproteobacteria bacterium]MBT6614557.1 GTP-binding protein [Deltaproteobacteria bacterium]MBT7714338.1 GTP-binding protein [Deltaproteobacteria bacterium]